MIRAAINSFRQVQIWQEALRLSARGQFEDALATARTMGPEIQNGMFDWRVFELQHLGLLKDHTSALERARALVAELLSKPRLTQNQTYFLVFAQWYGQVAFWRLHPTEPIPNEFKFDLASIDLSRVSRRFKRIFPMSIHPDWASERK
jgi:hypothetical protein